MVEILEVECALLNNQIIFENALRLAKFDNEESTRDKTTQEYVTEMGSPGMKAQIFVDGLRTSVSCPCYSTPSGAYRIGKCDITGCICKPEKALQELTDPL